MSTNPTIAERLAVLKPLTEYGPSYNRNVAEPYHTAVRMDASGRAWEAEYWTTNAEMRAELITFEQWEAFVASLRGE